MLDWLHFFVFWKDWTTKMFGSDMPVNDSCFMVFVIYDKTILMASAFFSKLFLLDTMEHNALHLLRFRRVDSRIIQFFKIQILDLLKGR
jgi:hypothetical protein